jgi:hypothetical protein
MRLKILALVALLVAVPLAASAQYQGCRQMFPGVSVDQACIQLSANMLLGPNGLPLTAGKVVLTVTDASGTPISYTPQGGTSSSGVFTAQVVDGAIQNIGGYPYTIVNSLTSSPANPNLYFHYQLESTDGSQVYLDAPLLNIFSSTGGYALDAYAAGAGTSISGLQPPRVLCAPSAKYTQTDAPAGAKPWICSHLWRTDNSNQWTQNPSANTQCPYGQAVVSPRVGNAYCIQPENAFALPGEGFQNQANVPGPISIEPINGSGGGSALPLGIPQQDSLGPPEPPARTAGALDLIATGTTLHPQWMSFTPAIITQTLIDTKFNEGSAGAPVIGTAPAINVPGNSWIGVGGTFASAPAFVSGGGMAWTSAGSQLMLINIGSYGGDVTYKNLVNPAFGFTLIGLSDATGANQVQMQLVGTSLQISKVVANIFTNIGNLTVAPTGTDTWDFIVSGQTMSVKLNGASVGSVTLPSGTPITTNQYWGVGFGAPNPVLGEFIYTGTTTVTNPIPAVGTFCLLGGNGKCGPLVPNQGMAPRTDGYVSSVPEIGYSTNSDGTSSIAWREDRNSGQFDVRRPRNGVTWASDPNTAFANTVNDAVCTTIATHILPTVNLPAGIFHVTNLQAPPTLTINGVNTQPNQQGTTLFNTNAANAVMVGVPSYTTSCNGVTTTFAGIGTVIRYIDFEGLGATAATDIGLTVTQSTGKVEYDSFNNFGGPGFRVTGINNAGDHLFLNGDLAWYYNSPSYNPSGFTDTAYHAAAELGSQDGQYHDIFQTGWQPSAFVAGQGYYNRWYLCGVLLEGSPSYPFTNSFVQVNANDLCLGQQGIGGYIVTNNRFDLAHFNSVRLPTGPAPQQAIVRNNEMTTACTSPTLNPANFPSDPGGVSPDPNCANIRVEEAYLTSQIGPNEYTGSFVPSWPVGAVFFEQNVSGQLPGRADEPGQTVIGQTGGDPVDGNQGVDVSQSMVGETRVTFGPGAPVIPMNQYRSIHLSSSTATSWTSASVEYLDTIRYIDVGPNDTIVNGNNLALCGGLNITGDTSHVLHEFYFWRGNLVEFGCGGSGTGVLYPSATQNALPRANIVGGVTSLEDSAFGDDGFNSSTSEPFYSPSSYERATGTATSSQNYVSGVTNYIVSYWDTSTAAAVGVAWSVYGWVAQGASPPATVLTYYCPTGLPSCAVLYAIDPALLATSSQNYASPKLKVRGACWNGTTSVLDDWNIQGVPGTGANPSETLVFSHSGCGGATVTLEMPGLKVDGLSAIGSGVATNSDIDGEFAFSAATTATYTWQNSYVSHPECVPEPQFSTTVAHWVTYTGVTSFTINFASAVTGNVGYLCLSRN